MPPGPEGKGGKGRREGAGVPALAAPAVPPFPSPGRGSRGERGACARSGALAPGRGRELGVSVPAFGLPALSPSLSGDLPKSARAGAGEPAAAAWSRLSLPLPRRGAGRQQRCFECSFDARRSVCRAGGNAYPGERRTAR